MTKYKSKPIVINAIQVRWMKNECDLNINEIKRFTGIKDIENSMSNEIKISGFSVNFMYAYASVGDYIIKDQLKNISILSEKEFLSKYEEVKE